MLWRKVKPSLSAGRVQSVAVRIIVEREREVSYFRQQECLSHHGHLHHGKWCASEGRTARPIHHRAEVMDFLQGCLGAAFTVEAVEKKPGKRTPAAPFTTSTLQQEASCNGYGVIRTMRIAQGLYAARAHHLYAYRFGEPE